MFSGKGKPFVNRVLADIMPQRNCRAGISDFVSAQEIKLRISRSLHGLVWISYSDRL